jgi:hypothetical protein
MPKPTATEKPLAASSYFEPDILTGHQFFKVFQQKSRAEPEQRLMLAVLTDAIECFQKYFGATSRRSRKLFVNAEAWIASRESSWPYSFEHICEALNINANYLRIGLMQWRVNHEAGSGPRKRIREPLRYRYRVKHHRVSI